MSTNYDSYFHRTIDRRDWYNATIRSLSSPPSARLLHLYLATGPHTGILPGLAEFSSMVAADYLGWPVEDTERCLLEIVRFGLASYDTGARVLWLHGRLAFAFPRNPNAVKRWAHAWNSIVDCPVKAAAECAFRKSFAERGPAFVDAFDQVCRRKPWQPARNGVRARAIRAKQDEQH